MVRIKNITYNNIDCIDGPMFQTPDGFPYQIVETEATEKDNMITIGQLLTTNFNEKKSEEATPESLRAAAKVLEDKATELEKPKLTNLQRAMIQYADDKDLSLTAFKDGKSIDIRGKTYGDKAGTIREWDSWEDAEVLTTKYIIYRFEGDTTYIPIKTFREEWCDWKVTVAYPL